MANEERRGFISDALKEQIRNANDVVELVGSYLTLQRAGSAFKATCPFHKERTASFMVNPERQTYHCFGCGAGGDAFKFIMQYEGVEFPDAVRMLAERAGIKLEFDGRDKKANPLYEALAAAQDLYYHQLRSDKGEKARDYLASRKLTMETADKFGLGFAPGGWDFIFSGLRRKGFSERILEEAGLAVSSRDPRGGYYDRFRNRLMFPIHNSAGKVIGFTGRALEAGDNFAKYLNSPETELFHKSKVLYGMRQAQRAVYDANQVVIVESNPSVLMCNQSGLENVIATSGTAFTEDHRDILLRKFPEAEIIFCFDGDEAGRKAGAKASSMVLGRGNTKVCNLPEGEKDPNDPSKKIKDPDDFIRARGIDYFRDRLAESKATLDFFVDYTREAKNLELSTPEGLITLLRGLREPLQKVPQESRAIVLEALSRRLGLKPESIAENVFLESVEEVRGGYNVLGRWEEGDSLVFRGGKIRELENNFVKMLLHDGNPDTIRYFCEERKACERLSTSEPRHLLRYLSDKSKSMPLFMTKTSLFRRSACQQIVDEISSKALKEGLVLNTRYLWYLLTKPVEDLERTEEERTVRRFSSEEDEKKFRKRIRRAAKPTLEEIEAAFETIEFRRNISIVRNLPYSLSSSQQEDLNKDLAALVGKYQKKEQDANKK